MLNIEEALKAILDHTTPLAPVTMPLDEAAGLVLAEDVIAHGNVPPFANSAMDGFAVIATDRCTPPRRRRHRRPRRGDPH
jgi:molybdopterin molybdotransferase